MFGLKDIHINSMHSVFRKFDAVERAVIYGSRAKGNFKNGSDIDIVLIGEQLDLTTLLKIENDLDDLLLPYKIDLSLFHKIENPDLTEHINRVGIDFYKREQDK